MIYDTPKVFMNDDTYTAWQFLSSLGDTPLMHHVNAEAKHLQPIFVAAAKALAPHCRYKEDENFISEDGLRATFTRTAAAFGYMCYGTPLMIGELFNDRLLNFCKENGTNFEGKTVTPPGGDTKNRMFGTATFGFYTLGSHTAQDSYSKRLIVPFYIVPDDFIHSAHAAPLLEKVSALSFWLNHDYFHQMIYTALDGNDFEIRNADAPAYKYLNQRFGEPYGAFDPRHYTVRRFETDWNNGTLTREFNMSGHIEPWAMRFHREVLTTMNSELGKDGPLWQAVDDVIDTYAQSPIRQSHKRMRDPAIYLQEYIMRLVAFNLVRAEPIEHPLVQHAINRFRDIDTSDNKGPADIKDPAEIFSSVYKTKYTNTFFGDGENHDMDIKHGYDTAEEYAGNVMAMSARSIGHVSRDAKKAIAMASMPIIRHINYFKEHSLR